MSEEPKHKSHGMGWTLAVVAVPVLYVLSIGPWRYVQQKAKVSLPVAHRVEMIYKPVYWLATQLSLRGTLDNYTYWWACLALGGDPFRAWPPSNPDPGPDPFAPSPPK